MLGRIAKRSGEMTSNSRGPGPSNFVRRSATVTISAPLATAQARFCSNERYLPLPMIRLPVLIVLAPCPSASTEVPPLFALLESLTRTAAAVMLLVAPVVADASFIVPDTFPPKPTRNSPVVVDV